jgi:tetratricopeptide (TPR) repeat protein
MQDAPSLSVSVPNAVPLPQARNRNFVGRQRVLEALHRSFRADGQLVQVIHGTGGVGKTQLALEYAYREREQYRTIAWLPASEPNTLAVHYRRLAERLGVAEPDALVEETRQAVKDALRGRSDWLLIFDDAPAPDAITPYLPGGGGHVLVTSRNAGWQQFGMPFCLRVLERAEAVEFLKRRLGPVTETPAATLAQAVGDLPLSLEQASAVIAEAGISIEEYLRRYESLWAELLQSGRSSSGDYPDTVAMTWELACRELENWDAEVSGMTKILAFMAPVEMPRTFLQRALGHLPVPFSTRFGTGPALDRAIDLLRRFSLIAADDRGVSIHPSIASLTRDRLPPEQHRNWSSAALGMMALAFHFEADSTVGWSDCAEALPHALASSKYAESEGVVPDTNAKLLNQIGEYLTHLGRLEQARQVFERALVLTETAHGANDRRRAAIINNLGRVLKRVGDLEQARARFEEALVLDQESYGQSHAHVAEVVNNYATVLHQSGDVELALRQFEWALEVCRSSYGDDHIKVAIVTNNLGYTRATIGDPRGALEEFNAALAIAESSVGPNHPIVASILTNIGAVLRRTGQADAARAPLERAAMIHRASLGAAHPEIARNFAHLGHLHQERGELELATRYFQRALQIDQNTLGETHVALIPRLEDLGKCLKQMNEVDASSACYERIAQIRRAMQSVA